MSDAKERIVAAAIQVVAREGLVATSTRKIAAEAGVNLAMLHYYFGNKEDLLAAVHYEIMQRTRALPLWNTPIRPGDDLRAILTGDFTAYWQFVEEAPEIQIVQYELSLYALRNPQAAERTGLQYDLYGELVQARCRQVFEALGYSCPMPLPDLARFIIAGIDGLILQYLSNRDTERAMHDLLYLVTATVALVVPSPSLTSYPGVLP